VGGGGKGGEQAFRDIRVVFSSSAVMACNTTER